MRRIVIISYTETGGQLNRRLEKMLAAAGDVAVSCREFASTGSLLKREWNRTSAFIFVGAAGIAVRHIAPLLTDKLHDPAVLVMDEKGQFVIPVLSGHIGGGVALAWEIAKALKAQAVITTATDVEGRFAVDIFAQKNHLRLGDPASVKGISAAVLRGEEVKVYTQTALAGEVPAGIQVCEEMTDSVCFRNAQGQECVLSPRRYIVGVGCKKGKSADELAGFLEQVCGRYGIGWAQIAGVASIDIKKEETGIWELSRRLEAPYEVFSAQELGQIGETVSASEFVRQTVGVDNVCERSALCLAKRWCGLHCACGLVAPKQAQDGMALAVAKFSVSEYHW